MTDQTPEKALGDYYDAVAAYGPPPEGEVDALVDTLTGGEFGGATVDRATLRRQITSTTRAIIADREEGESGNARRHGPAHIDQIRGQLGTAPPDRSDDIASIVDSIPRGF